MPRVKLPSGLGRRALIVASLSDAATLVTDARRAVKDGADLLEVRADLFPKMLLKPERLQRTLKKLRRESLRPIFLTLRMGEEGGGLSVKYREVDRLGLFRAALTEVDGVDVELAAVEINRHVVFEAHKRGRFVVLSAHDFKRTPSQAVLAGFVRKAKKLGGDILKVAAKPKGRQDVVRLMDFCSRSLFRRKAFIAMGPLGLASRLEGFRQGSCLTYGYIRRPLAPGQWPIARLAAALKQPPLS
ncbi:MAG: type I 3-dehydroquinate dehydratase [Elusimicrobia bacterium]|jgi:3-dehydroquinate dehydratase-1|nr:type I 3-dehydroquinate dehydratase [Elusimicrobiota bacterium]